MIPPLKQNPSPFVKPMYQGLERLKAQPISGDKITLLKQLGINTRRSFFQDTSFFKVALAPLASILLVTARVIMALKSAKSVEAGEDPQKAEYAKEQALMTITREVAGFGLSFGLMSVLNVLTDKPIQRLFGYTIDTPDVTGPVKALSQAFEIIVGKRKMIMQAPVALGSKTVIQSIEEEGLSPNFIQKQMRRLLSHVAFDSQLKTLPERMKAGMMNVRGIGVPLFSAGISVYLAGWLLERTALLKTDVILARIKQKRQKQNPSVLTSSPRA